MKKLLVPILLIAVTLSANGAAIHTGLLNYWDLDTAAADTAGSFAEATGTTTNNGSVNGAVTFGGGILGGGAASFPGGAGNNITIADPGPAGAFANDIDRSGADLSISVWFQLDNVDTGWQGLVAHGEGTDYRIAVRGTNDPIQYAYAGGGSGSDIFSMTTFGSQPGGDGLWHHLVATTAGSNTALYIDGNLEATGGTGPINENGQNTLCIGCNPTNGREWNGMIDDVGFWDRALTQDDVLLIYNSGLNGIALGAIPEPATVSLFALAGGMLIFRRSRR